MASAKLDAFGDEESNVIKEKVESRLGRASKRGSGSKPVKPPKAATSIKAADPASRAKQSATPVAEAQPMPVTEELTRYLYGLVLHAIKSGSITQNFELKDVKNEMGHLACDGRKDAVMSDPEDDDIPDGTTWGAHLRSLRRDVSFLVANQQRTMEHIKRLGDAMVNVQGDVLLLEMHDQSRDGEVLSIQERLDRAGIAPRPVFGLEASLISATKRDSPN